MTTKDKIIYEALSLFSQHGFEAVTIRTIASAVGIKESSVYNHFTSKKAILETIVYETLERYEGILQTSQLPETKNPNISDLYDDIAADDFYEICSRIFLFYLKDEYIAKLRRLLTIEQYANKELGEVFRRIFIDRVLENQTQVLQKFIDSGRFVAGDAYTMALHFYGPVFLLLYKYDLRPEDEEQAILELKTHVMQYNALYRKAKEE